MLLKVAGVVLLLVIWRGRVEVAPTWTVPKLSESGVRVRVDGVAEPRRLMKSRASLESEGISRALMRLVVGEEVAWGVKVRVMVQAAPGTMGEVQPFWRAKSGVVCRDAMW